MALPKAEGMSEDLVKRAAGMGGTYGGDEEESDDAEPTEDDVMKEEFMAMAKAIREGDDEAAYEAYLACKGG